MKRRTNHKTESVLVLMLLLSMVACSEVIDLYTENEGGVLVIYGRITDGTLGNIVELSRTMASGQTPEPISDASIKVLDEANREGIYHETEPGVYQLEAGFQGVAGTRYHMEVTLPDGTQYASVPEEMPYTSAKDSLYFFIEPIETESLTGNTTITEDVIQIFADTDIYDSRPDLFMRWTVQEVYSFEQIFLPSHNFPWYDWYTCYITNDLEQQRVLLYDGEELNATGIFGQSVTNRLIDETFRGLRYFNYTQQTLTREAFEYWKAVDQNTNRVGSIFDLPPGFISNNLYNVNDPDEPVLGYFEVSASDTARLRITNSIVNRFFNEACPYNTAINRVPLFCYECLEPYLDPECIDCLLLHNSSHERPGYFN